ncbi:hypothetical protein GCM10010208_16320 [Actinomadura livida]|nr:hypothetical protein GCM10010208_16320 [Actinomadura livida]
MLDAGSLLASLGQVRIPSAGAASASISTDAASSHGQGRRPTCSAQRRIRGDSTTILAPAARSRRRSTRRPASPSTAGSSVTALSIVVVTTSPVVNPIVMNTGIPDSTSPHSASSTVHPAKITDWPAVALARATDSGTVSPSAMPSRCRVRTSSA